MSDIKKERLLKAREETYWFYVKELAEAYNTLQEKKKEIYSIAKDLRTDETQSDKHRQMRVAAIKSNVDFINILRQRIDILTDTISIVKETIKEINNEKK